MDYSIACAMICTVLWPIAGVVIATGFLMERRGRMAGLGHFTFAVVELTFLLFIVLQVWHEVFHLARMLCSDTPLPFSQSRLTSISERQMREI